MLSKLFQAAVLKRIAARTPLGAAAVIGGSWYLKHRRAKRGQPVGATH